MPQTCNIPVASPLFILRNECTANLEDVLGRLKASGFDGVEFLGLFGHEPHTLGEKMKELGLKALGDHVPYAQFMEDAQAVFSARKAVGCAFITVGDLPAGIYTDLALLDTVMAQVGQWARMARDFGMTLLFHNHAGELRDVFGATLLTRLMEHPSAKELALEADLGWMAIGGANPLAYITAYKDRCPVIHLKDFYMDGPEPSTPALAEGIGKLYDKRGDASLRHFEFRPNGYGIANTPLQMPYVLACNPQFIVADHDLAYDRNSFDDLALSLAYIRSLLAIHQA